MPTGLNVTLNLGRGGGDVEVIVQRNTNSASRSKNFTVRTASGLSKSVNVTQAGAGARTIDVYCLLNTVAPALTRVVGTFQESYQAPTQIIVSGGIVFTTTDSGIGELSQAFTFTINSGNSGGVVTLSELQVPDDVVLVSVNLQKSTASCNPSTYDGNTFVADWTTPPNS